MNFGNKLHICKGAHKLELWIDLQLPVGRRLIVQVHKILMQPSETKCEQTSLTTPDLCHDCKCNERFY